MEGHPVLPGTILANVWQENIKKGGTERRFSNQTISHFMCSHPPLPLFLSPFLSLIGAHSLVFHHTSPHLNFTNPIYCYLYPRLLLSLLLLLLLLWLELLSSCAIFSFYFHGFKYWFSELGGCLGRHRERSASWDEEGDEWRVKGNKKRSSYWVLLGGKKPCHVVLRHFLLFCLPKIVNKTCWEANG